VSHHPHTIDNGAGERLTFLGVRSDEQGEYLEVRNSVSLGSGPPMHVRHLQEEVLTVERGTMGWQRLGEEEHLARSGESVTPAPGEVHRFSNAGDDELICTGFVRPPDNLEYFLTQIYASTRANRGRRPRLFDTPTSCRATAPSSRWRTFHVTCSALCFRSSWSSACFSAFIGGSPALRRP
jgi:quercetin dioxygenase-like cupin family protein